MSFADVVRQSRKEAGLSQEELADVLNVSRQSVAKWESDAGFPEMRMALLLATCLNRSLDELFGGELSQLQAKFALEKDRRIEDEAENEASKSKATKKKIIDAALGEIEQRDDSSKNILTGYSFIDDGPVAINRCGFLVICGGKLTAKTAFALNIAKNVIEEGGKVTYFLNRSSSKRIMRVLLGIISGVDTLYVKDMTEKEKQKLRDAGAFIENSGFELIDAFDSSVELIYEKCVNNPQSGDLIIIDSMEGFFSKSKGTDVSRIYDRLRKMAPLCHSAVMALTDMDKSVEEMLINHVAKEKVMEEALNKQPIRWNEGLILLFQDDDSSCGDKNISVIAKKHKYDSDGSVIIGSLNENAHNRIFSEVK